MHTPVVPEIAGDHANNRAGSATVRSGMLRMVLRSAQEKPRGASASNCVSPSSVMAVTGRPDPSRLAHGRGAGDFNPTVVSDVEMCVSRQAGSDSRCTICSHCHSIRSRPSSGVRPRSPNSLQAVHVAACMAPSTPVAYNPRWWASRRNRTGSDGRLQRVVGSIAVGERIVQRGRQLRVRRVGSRSPAAGCLPENSGTEKGSRRRRCGRESDQGP